MTWCPWQSKVLATRGGMKDGILSVWHMNCEKIIQSAITDSQVKWWNVCILRLCSFCIAVLVWQTPTDFEGGSAVRGTAGFSLDVQLCCAQHHHVWLTQKQFVVSHSPLLSPCRNDGRGDILEARHFSSSFLAGNNSLGQNSKCRENDEGEEKFPEHWGEERYKSQRENICFWSLNIRRQRNRFSAVVKQRNLVCWSYYNLAKDVFWGLFYTNMLLPCLDRTVKQLYFEELKTSKWPF